MSVCLISWQTETLNMKMKAFFAFFSNHTDNLTFTDMFFYYKNSFREVSSIKEIVCLYCHCLFNMFVICNQL